MITIIGGSGFVGSRLISILDSKNILNLDKSTSKKHYKITSIGDIRNLDEIKFKSNTKVVVLLAAEHKDNVEPKSLYYDVNVSGTKNVLNKMEEKGISKIIFTSSVAVYGLDKKNPNEESLLDPFNHYGKSKMQAEKIIFDWFNKNPKKRSAIIIRPSVIFGEENRGNVYNLLKSISNGKFIMVGSGLNKKSMAYVGNVVEFLKHKIYSSEEGFNIYNYSDSPDLNMNQLVDIIKSEINVSIPSFRIPYSIGMILGYILDFIAFLTKRKFPLSSVRIKKFCAITQFDSTKAHLKFNPPFSLKDSIIETINNEFGKN